MKTATAPTTADRVPMPPKMLRAFKHSTDGHRQVFRVTYRRLIDSGLDLYPTNCPDLRARHPKNDIVFVTLWFQEMSGTRIEVRIDGCPTAYYNTGTVPPSQLRNYDPKTRALWAVYPIRKNVDLDAALTVIERVKAVRPGWGNALTQNRA